MRSVQHFANDWVGLVAVIVVTIGSVSAAVVTTRTQRKTRDENQDQHGTTAKELRKVRDAMLDTHRANRVEHQRIMEALPTPMFRAGSDGRCTWANRAYLAALGLTYSEVLGDGWLTGVVDADREFVESAWAIAVAERQAFGPTRIRYGSGLYEVTALPVTHPDGSVEYVGTAHPVDEPHPHRRRPAAA